MIGKMISRFFLMGLMAGTLSVSVAHEGHDKHNEKITQLMKEMGKELKDIRRLKDKEEILTALSNIQMHAEKAKAFEPHVVRDGVTDKTQEDYVNGMQYFIDEIEAIKVEIGTAEKVKGADVFKQVRDLKDNGHEYFSVD